MSLLHFVIFQGKMSTPYRDKIHSLLYEEYKNTASRQLTITRMEDKNMAAVTKDTTIGEVLMINMNVAPIFYGMGMHCLGCPASQGETIEEAAWVHGIDPEIVLKELNEYIEAHPEETNENIYL